MMNPLRFLLNSQLKRSKLAQTIRGFTLIELLVAMILAVLVITPLLGFMINIMDSDRKEQAKARSEQEIQSALDYIAKDLEEAVYIYDADGIAAIKNQLPNPTAIDKVPVLVFWKRAFLPKELVVTSSTGTSTQVGCLVKFSDNTCDQRDYFVYSLVAYYLIKENDPTLSSDARIRRFEIQDGIKDPNNSNNYLTNPNPGFKLFDLTLPGILKDKMNAWTKGGAYDLNENKIEPLVDYIDQSTGTGVPAPVSCTTTSSTAQQVPANGTTANPLEIYSFYACVDSSRTLARVYLRGNALARISQGATYSNSQSTYFSTANVQVQGRGVIGN